MTFPCRTLLLVKNIFKPKSCIRPEMEIISFYVILQKIIFEVDRVFFELNMTSFGEKINLKSNEHLQKRFMIMVGGKLRI